MKKTILFLLITGLTMSALLAQKGRWEEVLNQKVPSHLAMASCLYQISSYAEIATEEEVQSKIDNMQLLQRRDGKINVEILVGEVPQIYDIEKLKNMRPLIDKAMLEEIGVEMDAATPVSVSAWIAPAQLESIASRLPQGYRMTEVYIPFEEDNEGPTDMFTNGYAPGGADGSGMTVAIIDGGFDTLLTAINNGVVAQPTFTLDYSGGGFDVFGQDDGSVHGVGCYETAFDHAPGANFELYRVSNATHGFNAMWNCIIRGVNIISHSLSRYNTGWADNTGTAAWGANIAAASGILVFTSAGNRAQSHWQGNFNDPNNNLFHNWSGNDERLDFSIPDTRAARLSMQWNDPNGSITDDYDLILVLANTNIVLASSLGGSTFESITWTNNFGVTVNVQVMVLRKSANPAQFELFNHQDAGVTNFEYQVAGRSTTSPSNATLPNVISVGAVNTGANYASASGTGGLIAGYSSQGPTNSGTLTPDIVAPTATTTFAYNGGFTGTSCSTPNAAGAAAAFWSAHPNYTADAVREVMFRKARLYADWGAANDDFVYGRGGIKYYPYFPNTVYIFRDLNNVAGSNTMPYFNMEQADANGVAGGRGVFLGRAYQQPPPGYIIKKPMVYVSLIETAIVR